MKCYHYVNGKRTVYNVEPGVSVEQVFNETRGWPGVRFVMIPGGKQ